MCSFNFLFFILEAEVVNQAECNETLKPICRCKTKAGYFGTDPDLCELTEEKNCLPGFYLSSEYGKEFCNN